MHDADSLNGIKHNEELLTSGQSQEMHSDDNLEIGAINLKVLDAKDFFTFVHEHIENEKR